MKHGVLRSLLVLLAACARPQDPLPGMIEDPSFTRLGREQGSAWRVLQHAGVDSYQVRVADGILRIERDGPEPWGKVVQTVPVGDLVGRTLEWSADVRGALKMPAERFVTPSGLTAVLVGRSPGAPLALGEGVLDHRSGEPELAAGEHPWIRQRVRITIPEGASRLEVGVILGHEGWIELRHPTLRALP